MKYELVWEPLAPEAEAAAPTGMRWAVRCTAGGGYVDERGHCFRRGENGSIDIHKEPTYFLTRDAAERAYLLHRAGDPADNRAPGSAEVIDAGGIKREP